MYSFCLLLLGQHGSAGETKAEGEQRGFGVVGRSTDGRWALGSLAGRLPVAGRSQNDTQREDRVCRPPHPGPAKQSLGQRVVQNEAPHWGHNRAGQSTWAQPPAPTRHHAEKQVRDKACSGQETQGWGQRWALRQSARHRRAPHGESKSRHGAQLGSSRVPSPRPQLRVAPAPGGGRGDAARGTSIGEKGLEVPRATRVQARGPG